MKALTLYQPWATLIGMGLKQFETRPRRLSHRGPIAIHAGKKMAEPAIVREIRANMPLSHRHSLPLTFPQGAVVAIADMTDCLEMTPEFIDQQTTLERLVGNWEVGRWAYRLENIRMLPEPVMASGSQGLWNLDDATLSGHI